MSQSHYETVEGKMPNGQSFTIESNTDTNEAMAKHLGQEPAEKPKSAHAEPQADGDDGEAEETPAAPPAGKSERQIAKHDMKARMAEATRKESEAKAEAAKDRAEAAKARAEKDEIQRRAEAYEAELTKLRKPAEPARAEAAKTPEGKPRPKLDDFQTIEDHAEAVAEWALDRREAAKRETEAAERKQAAEKTAHETYTKKLLTFADGFKQKIAADPLLLESEVVKWVPISNLSDLSKANQTNFIAQQFIERERGLDLLVFLRDHPEEAQRLSTMRHPVLIEDALDAIEKGFTGAIADTPVKSESSKAAPPARSVTGGPPIKDNGPAEDDSDDDFVRKMKAARLRKLKASA